MPDRREDTSARDRLNAIQRGYERWTRHTIMLLSLLFVTQFALGGLSVYLLGQNAKRSDEMRSLLKQVQMSRVSSVSTQCREQNERHDNTVGTLNQFVAEFKRTHHDLSAKDRKDVEQSIQGNVMLINALAPKRDCAKRAHQLVTLGDG